VLTKGIFLYPRGQIPRICKAVGLLTAISHGVGLRRQRAEREGHCAKRLWCGSASNL